MPSIGVAQATSSATPVTVLKRELLWGGGAIAIKIPTDAEEGQYPSDVGPPNRFLRFPQNVKGGVVNIFCHLDPNEEPESVRGKKFILDVGIWRKTLSDGRQYLYVDLDTPISKDSTLVTDRLAVMSCKASDIVQQEGLTVFETPAPLDGVIVVTPAESKIWVKAQLTVVEKTKKSTTGDSQLDHYLADGWKVASEDEREVRLLKDKNGKLCRIVHKKPKSGKKHQWR